MSYSSQQKSHLLSCECGEKFILPSDGNTAGLSLAQCSVLSQVNEYVSDVSFSSFLHFTLVSFLSAFHLYWCLKFRSSLTSLCVPVCRYVLHITLKLERHNNYKPEWLQMTILVFHAWEVMCRTNVANSTREMWTFQGYWDSMSEWKIVGEHIGECFVKCHSAAHFIQSSLL